MGAWFLSPAFGNLLGGWIAGFYGEAGQGAPSGLFGGIAAYCLISAAVLLILVRPIKKLMVGVK